MPVSLDHPIYLGLWLLVPAIWVISRRTGSGAQSSRLRLPAGLLRSLLVVVLGLALCNPRWMGPSDQVNLFFCLDGSDSIAADRVAAAQKFVQKAAANMQPEDEAGLIVFGEHASLEQSLGSNFAISEMRSAVNPNFTNIYEALQLAIGKFPGQGQNKIILLTDGNENVNQAVDMAQLARSLGVEIDPVPLSSWYGEREVFVTELVAPPVVPLVTPFEIRLVVMSATANHGELILTRNDQLVVNQTVTLQPGKNTFTFADVLKEPDLYLYRAVINAAQDGYFQNNEGLAFTRAARKSPVLYVTDNQRRSTALAETLKLQGVDLVQKSIDELPTSIQGLVDYNAIIFDNVSGRSVSPGTMEAIESYVKDTGGGLIMIGGNHSFGAGDYGKTPVEKALPVSMDVPTELELPELCLVFVIDKSSSMATTYNNKSKLEMAKIAAFSAIEMLNPTDSVGIVVFDTQFKWTVPVTRAAQRKLIASSLSQVLEDGGTDLYPALQDVFQTLRQIHSAKRHVIVLSDGETNEADFQTLVEAMRRDGISVSTVAIGSNSDVGLMRSIAQWGGGRAYYTDDPGTIPKIFTGETRIVANKIIDDKTMQPHIAAPSDMLQGINDGDLPAVYGQVLTYPKPGAEVLIETEEGPLLAAWRYGLGRSAAFTSDLTSHWGKDWVKWEHFGQFAAQVTKWVQRKETIRHYATTVARRVEDGELIVDVTDDRSRYVNRMNLQANILAPSGKNQTIALEQTAPGRYQGVFSAAEIGAYYVSLFEPEHSTPYVFGYAVAHTDEFAQAGVNITLLEHLAELTRGKVLSLDTVPGNLFNTTAQIRTARFSFWPYLTLAFLLLLIADVALRKISRLRSAVVTKEA
jgi:Ca-activated chloride channel family protein